MQSSPYTRAIPSTGEQIPIVGLGTWQTFDVGRGTSDRAPLEECVRSFTALGGRVIDSSPMYGRSEQVIGDVIAKLSVRERVFVATKVWASGRQRGLDQMKASIRKLRVEKIDLLQVHNLVDVHTHLETLREWKAEGLVRYIGVTHYTATHHGDVARVLESEAIDFVQINYSVAEREAEQRVLPLAAERGVATIVNRPFGAGQLLGRLRNKPVPEWATTIGCDSWAQLLLKFVVSHPAVTCAIPATSNPDHLRDNMRAATGAMPDDAAREEIARAFRAAR